MTMAEISFRPYCHTDRQACASIFAANCPEFFAPNEREDYEEFLDVVTGEYEVCEVDGSVRGAFGLFASGDHAKTLNWIMLDPNAQGIGLGSKIMERVIQQSRRSGTRMVRIAASHKSAPFFARFGAIAISSTANGWGPGMDRVDMELSLPGESNPSQ